MMRTYGSGKRLSTLLRRLLLPAVLFLASQALWAQLYTEDPDLPNQNIIDKGFIKLGESKNDVVQPNVKHVYRIEINKDTFIIIDQVKDNSNLDAYLSLMKNDGTMIRNDDDGGGNLNSQIISQLSKGTYKIVAGGLGNSGGAYRLTAKALDVKSLAPGKTLKDAVTGGEMKLYVFENAKSGVVTITARRTDSSSFSPYMDLKTTKGDFLEKDDNPGGYSDAKLTKYLDEGTYHLYVKSYNASGGQYEIAVNRQNIQPQEYNCISLGQTRKGFILSGQKHTYDLKVPLDMFVVIDQKKDNSNLDAFLILQDKNGSILQQDDDGGEGLNSRISRFVNAGDYKILAGGLGNSGGQYELTVKGAEAKKLTSGSELKDSVPAGDVRIYYFEVAKSSLVTIDGRGLDDSSFAPYMDLQTEQGKVLATDKNNGSCPCSRVSTYLEAGKYTLLLKGYNNLGGDYGLTMKMKSFIPQEFNTISLGETRKGWIAPNQKHVYDFTLGKNGYVVIDNAKDNSNLDAYLWLQNESGVELQKDDDSGGNLNSRIVRELQAGKYKIIAGGLGASSGQYRLTVKMMEVKSLVFGKVMKDSVAAGDMKMYVIDMKNSGTINILAKREDSSSFSPYMDLKTDTGAFVEKDNNPGSSPSATLVKNMNAGKYQLFVKDYKNGAGNYSLLMTLAGGGQGTLDKTDTGDTTGGSQQAYSTIDFGQVRKGTLSAGQKHYYTFKLAKEAFVRIDQKKDNSNLDCYLYLESANGMNIASDDDSGGNLNSSIFRKLGPGEYKIGAGTYSGSSGAYMLTVEEVQIKQLVSGKILNDTVAPGESKLYVFEMKSQGLLSVICRSTDNSSFSPYIDIKTMQGANIGADSNNGKEPFSGIMKFLNAGTYNILLKGYNNQGGSYSLIIREEQ